MARRKTPKDETPEQKKERLLKEKIANSPNRAEKVSWNRKLKNLEKLYEKVQPIEEKVLKLIVSKQPILDKMQEIREVMVTECIHPFDHLVVKDNHIVCKFCNRKIKILNDQDT